MSEQNDHNHDGLQEMPPRRVIDRRDFLKISGFGLGGMLLAGCQQAKVEKAIPFLVQPEEVIPGVATWYSSMCGGCSAGCGVMAKTRAGRPVKLEGIPGHPISRGGLCAIGQAHLLGLYDSRRLLEPMKADRSATWEEIDGELVRELEAIRRNGGAVRVLTGTVTSPTLTGLLRRFLAGFKNGKHIQYDALSVSAILDAYELTHGVRLLPQYRFDRAAIIASFDADFLGTWISPVEYTAGYGEGRVLNGTASRYSYHAQFESRLSVTGSKADDRLRMSPDELRTGLDQLFVLLAQKAGVSNFTRDQASDIPRLIRELAGRLWDARGKSLVICGINDLGAQLTVNGINHLLGNYGSTIDLERPSFQRQGSDADLLTLLNEIQSGDVAALFVQGCNPVYDLPEGHKLAEWIKRIPFVVSYADRLDETAVTATYVCPEPHALESWHDGEPVANVVSIRQPVIKPFGNSRTFIESLSAWMGEQKSSYDLIRDEWQRSIVRRQIGSRTFQDFWDDTVQQGFAEVHPVRTAVRHMDLAALKHPSRQHTIRVGAEEAGLALVLYPSFALLDGRHAHNPWLQELPDPITKIVWDNYLSISPATAQRFAIQDGDIVRAEAGGRSIELPAHIQQGQHDAVVAIALGYGRRGTDRFTDIGPSWIEAKPTVPPGALVGKNAAPLLSFVGRNLAYDSHRVTLTKTGERYTLACTQDHHSLKVPEHLASKRDERRPIVQEAIFAAYLNDQSAGSYSKGKIVSLWGDDHQYAGHHWGMAIDLSACTGCSACVVSCVAENNIPVVGKDEVHRTREMTWIRLDRYYDEMEDGSVRVSHQPMLCQHCDNAPCETVCPVLATVHSDEGLNQQVYNRCVGTRYCSNNCPYKVRRFNWFDYELGDAMQRLVLNPDITTRERGIMEKCSFCVQRIQEAKIEAKKQGSRVRDGEIQPACAQSCPAHAIVFGDMNDPESQISRRMKDPRFYRVLDELGVKPSVGYMTLVRNPLNGNGEVGHG